MFERFTRDARQAVVLAQEEARQLHHRYIGTEHLLLGLLGQRETPSSQVLSQHGINREQAFEAVVRYVGTDDLDADALATVGIDLSAVRERVEATFGKGALDKPAQSPRGRSRVPGHIPFTPRAKKVLELSLREALNLKHNYIGDGHILLGLLREGEGVAMKVIHDRGVDTDAVHTNITTALAS